MKDFESFWKELQKEFATKKKVKNWTFKKKYFGDDFSAQINSDNQIVCITPNGSVNRANKSDFEWVYDNWKEYLSGRIQRKYLTKNSRVTKYTISITRQLMK